MHSVGCKFHMLLQRFQSKTFKPRAQTRNLRARLSHQHRISMAWHGSVLFRNARETDCDALLNYLAIISRIPLRAHGAELIIEGVQSARVGLGGCR